MAHHTDIHLRSKIIYQIFPRQHTQSGDFLGVIHDLDRIKSLGVDMIYLLPIHPIGQLKRKGTAGSPYSIVDYYAIHPDLGTLDDFKMLIDKAHEKGLKVMIDIVFNHTSRDSVLTKQRPEWFYKDKNGLFANRVGDWSDITDINFENHDVWPYFIDVLSYWAPLVDGFRCDVAPLLPLGFWAKARAQLDVSYPNLIWLTESVHPGFIKHLRQMDYDAHTDSEMYQVFDLCYDYDIHDYMLAYLDNPKHLNRWLEEIERQDMVYPKNYVKLRSFENHDQVRLRSKTRDDHHFKQMLSLMFFIKGTPMIYAGQEHQATHAPSLFEVDLITWDKERSVEPLIRKLSSIKKDPLFVHGHFNMHHKDHCAMMSYHDQTASIIGIFNLEHLKSLSVPLKDGRYINLVNDQVVTIKNQSIDLNEAPIIIKTTKENLII
ncbi:MAG: alpha-amylase family glycosyl hydrolase [Acholeplasmataceae bacterium]